MSSVKFIDEYFSRLSQVIRNVSKDNIEKAIDILFDAWRNQRNIFIIGNGGSASTATHFACDLSKSTIVKGKKRFKVMSMVDNIPLVSAWTNDGGFGTIFKEQLEPWLEESDVLIALSVHGGSGEGDAGPWSQNLTKAIKFAKEKKAKVIGFSGFDGGAMKLLADASIVVPIDTEPFGTPIVESMHAALEHLIVNCLREKIENYG